MSAQRGGGPRPTEPKPARSVARPQLKELVQRQARALGDPTRYEIFRFVAGASSPVKVGTLVEHFGFNHSAIRQHLAKLCDARLLTEELAPSTATGRPPLQYRVAPAAMGTWGTPGPYELLAVLLLKIAKGLAAPREAGAAAGRELADGYQPGVAPLDALESEMARRGFEPRREYNEPMVELVLGRCPFEVAAASDPDIVCCVHRGLAEGILDGMGSDLEVTDLVTHHPSEAGCRLQMRVAPAGPRPRRRDAASSAG